MQATLALRAKAMALLAADATTLAQVADENLVILVKDVFSPSEASAIGDLTEADFDGYAALECGLGTQPDGLNPLNDDCIITFEAPAGGWRFETTGATNLPMTIYGFALVNNAKNLLFGCETLDEPIVLTGTGQVINLPPVLMTQKAGSII